MVLAAFSLFLAPFLGFLDPLSDPAGELPLQVLAHLFSELLPVAAFLDIAGAAGRILGGRLADVVGALPSYMLMSLGQTVVVVWFAYLDWMPGIWALAVLFGLFFSGVMTSILICVRVMIPARLTGRGMAITSLFGWIGMGLGGVQGGVAFDLTGDYQWSYNTAAISGVVNLCILSAFYLRLRRRTIAARA